MTSTWNVAYQTIIFGPQIEENRLPDILDGISAAGFKGVEFRQPPGTLPRIPILGPMLVDRHLELLGLAGGSLQERMDYCESSREPYLYVEEWDPARAQKAIDKGFRLALHPHVFKKVHSVDDAFKVLWDHKELLWMPDTAHTWITGLSPVRALQRYRERLVAIHLKDWSPKFGRWSHRYARGFTDLGSGTVPFKEFLRELKCIVWDKRSAGLAPRPWLIVEQDYAQADPMDCVFRAAEWLAEHELMDSPPKRAATTFAGPWKPVELSMDAPAEQREHEFLRALEEAASRDPELFYSRAIEAFASLFKTPVALLSACSPAHQMLSLLASYPGTFQGNGNDAKLEETLARIAIERQTITVLDLRSSDPGLAKGWPGLNSALQHVWQEHESPFLVVLPIFNAFNTNHVRAVIQFLRKAPLNREEDKEDLNRMTKVAEVIARVSDSWLNDRCLTASAGVNLIAEQAKSSNGFLEEIVKQLIVKEAIGCEACSVFLADAAGKRLDLAATTGVTWKEDLPSRERYYKPGEGLTGMVLQERMPRLVHDAAKEKGWLGKSKEIRPSMDLDAFLLAPITDQVGKILGVVRCINKINRSTGKATHFSDEDLAIVDAIFQTAVPHLLRLLDAEQQTAVVERLKHEFKGPLSGIRGSIDRFSTSIALLVKKYPAEMRMEFLKDALEWSELLAGMVEHMGSFNNNLQPTKVRLFPDVVSPVIRQVGIQAKQQGLPRENIVAVDRFVNPELWIDKMRFHQVFFNLLDNAVKYAKDDLKAFKIEVAGERRADEWRFAVRDWGVGIEKGWEEAIFQQKVRAPGALRLNVTGQGIGLWVVSQIVAAHGGKISVTHLSEPTEITFTLPTTLELPPPEAGEAGKTEGD